MIRKIKYKIELYKINKLIKKIKPINMYVTLNILKSYKNTILQKDYQNLYNKIIKKYPDYKKRLNAIPKEIAFKDI